MQPVLSLLLHSSSAIRHLCQDENGLDVIDADYGRLVFEISQVDVIHQCPWWRFEAADGDDKETLTPALVGGGNTPWCLLLCN